MNFLDFNTTKLTSFEPSEFYSDTFSVDEFIQRKRYSVPLDVLRDDLGSHLKTLRSSLIELINQDYGQFVNLSSNLVGLDGKIQNIIGPLTRAENDIQNLYRSIEDTIKPLQIELEERRSIRAAQSQVQLLRRAHASLLSSEKYLSNCTEDIQNTSDLNTLRVACDKISDTKQLIQRCLPSSLVYQLQSRIESCCTVVLTKLEFLLRTYADTIPEGEHDTDENSHGNSKNVTVESILFMFSQFQWEVQAESILVNYILKPKCDSVLARKGNIFALFEEIETFIQLSPVLNASRQLDKFKWMKNYEFLTRAIFPFVVNILIKQFPHIWSPSNPDSFHSNWIRYSTFIQVVESALPSLNHLKTFRESVTLKDFLTKWQFNVYFQLRFHSLAIELESGLESIHSKSFTPDFKLDATRVLVKVINQCWDADNVFIVELSGRFLKASALFISRYLKEIETQVTSNPKVSLDQLISVFADLTLCELVMGQVLNDKIVAIENLGVTVPVPVGKLSSDGEMTCGARFLSMFNWQQTRESLETKLGDLTITESISFISSVNEVPRLFRRTNRDVPTKPSDYVTSILKPIQVLHQSLKRAKQGDLLERVGPKVGQQVTNRYKIQMDEVLISVQRMEESLKRLKKVKGQNQTDAHPPQNRNDCDSENSKINNANLSDDNKIRRQIQLDYEYLTDQVREKN